MPAQNVLGIFDQGIVSGTSFVMTLVIGRLCGAQELGTFALAISIVMLITALHDALISIPFTILRPQNAPQLQAVHAGNSLIQVFLLGALVSIMCLAFSIVMILGFPERPLGLLSLLIATAVPAVLLRQFARRYLFATGAIIRAVVIDSGVAFVQLTAVAAMIALGWLSAPVGLVVLTTATTIVPVTWLILHRREFRPNRSSFISDVQRHWRRGRWLLGGEMLSVTCGYATIWILALTMDRTAAGVFAACNVIVQLTNPFLLGVGNVLEGRAARALADGGPRALREVVASAFRLFTFVIGIVTIFATLFGARLVELFYGSQYANRGQIIALMAFALLATASGIASSCGLRVIGRADLTFAACALDLTILVTVALVLAPHFGICAVAAAVLAGSTAGTIFRLIAFTLVSREK
jgi:O-antigen/teichoic acid export membrane protein